MIVATAGHIDHGKTLLIKALTGQDTDRLPEEKARGMTIDLGFAYLPVANHLAAGNPAIGFIDSPGHERFIRNMLCGVAAIDFVLLVIAADDGPMPQTRSHLEILDLLNVRRGAIVLTKVDRVDSSRLELARAECLALVNGTSLLDAPLFEVSATTGSGVDVLREYLVAFGAKLPPRSTRGHFRLAVDRCFTLSGAGLVVTGSAVSGLLSVGDTVEASSTDLSLRARSIHAQNRPADVCRAGQRCAINLAGSGLRSDGIERGDWIVDPAVAQPTSKIDVRLRVLSSERRMLVHWTPVHVHIGTSDVLGRIATLQGSIEPGHDALAQILLDRPVGALCGDRFVLRDHSSRRNIGGGRVLDIFPPVRGRARPERLAYLTAMEDDDDAVALRSLLDVAPAGLDLTKFCASRNLRPDESMALFATSEVVQLTTPSGVLGFSSLRWQALTAQIVQGLSAWHEQSPDSVGPPADRILDAVGLRLPRDSVLAIAGALSDEGVVVKTGLGVRLPTHRPRMAAADEALWQRVQLAFPDSSMRPPTVHDIAEAIGSNVKNVERALQQAARHGRVVQISPKRYFGLVALRALGEILESLAANSADGLVDAASFRDSSGIGRNLTIEVLEFFDRVRFTRRVKNARKVLRRAGDLFAIDPTLAKSR